MRAGDQSRKINICVNRLSISLYLLSCLSHRTLTFDLSIQSRWYIRRRCTCTRKPCRRWSIPYRRLLLTILSPGLPHRRPTATSARVFSGASLDRECDVWSAVLNVTKSARTSWTPIACRVSNISLYFCKLASKRITINDYYYKDVLNQWYISFRV